MEAINLTQLDQSGLTFAQRRTHLTSAAYLIIAATALNAVYFALRYTFGYGYGTFLVGPKDRFADLVKVALSFKTITWPLTETEAFATWPNLYKDYLPDNPYGGIANLAAGKLTHFHHPPFSQLLFTLFGLLITHSQSATIALWTAFGICAKPYLLGDKYVTAQQSLGIAKALGSTFSLLGSISGHAGASVFRLPTHRHCAANCC